MSKLKKNEIIIAVIGLLGVLATAVFSNWDKIFPNNGEVRAKYTDYRATEDFETELRHFFNVSGTRKSFDSQQKHLVNNLRIQLISEYPEEAKEIDALINASLEEAISFDEIISKLLPVYRNHFTVEELQELNKFYSTEIMQNMVRKLPLLAQEAAPIQVEMLQETQKRIIARLQEILKD